MQISKQIQDINQKDDVIEDLNGQLNALHTQINDLNGIDSYSVVIYSGTCQTR